MAAEHHKQVAYHGGALAGVLIPGTERLEGAINPALALMLFVTFLQVPIASLKTAFRNGRFFAALLAVNFIVVFLLKPP